MGWDQSQSEIWYSLLGACSVWAIRRIERTPRAELAAGAFAAAALIMKPPAIWFTLIALVLLVRRAGKGPQVQPVLYGLLRSAGGLALTTLVALARRTARERHLVVCALVLAGMAATAMQRKLYMLHWTSLLAPASAIGALLAADARDLLPWRKARVLAPTMFAAALVTCFMYSDRYDLWLRATQHVTRFVRREISREQYANCFCFPEIRFWYGESERVGCTGLATGSSSRGTSCSTATSCVRCSGLTQSWNARRRPASSRAQGRALRAIAHVALSAIFSAR